LDPAFIYDSNTGNCQKYILQPIVQPALPPSSTLVQLLNNINSQIELFDIHLKLCVTQREGFNESIKNIPENKMVIVYDYKESVRLNVQGGIQLAQEY